jgi:hypothetical protein
MRMEGSGQVPFLLAERARSECARSMRAVKANLAAPLRRLNGVKAWARADDLLCSRNARPRKALVECAQWEINQAHS